MAVKKIQVIGKNGKAIDDVIMAKYLGDDSGSYTYDSLNDKLNDVAHDASLELGDAIDNINAALALKAPLASPELTGEPTAPTPAAADSSTKIANTSWVQALLSKAVGDLNSEISTFAGAMIFKGTLGGTVTSLPDVHEVGWTYRVVKAGIYAGIECEVGDMITCITAGTSTNNAHWTVYQTNIDGAIVGPDVSIGNNVAVFNGTTGKIIKDSGLAVEDIVTGPSSAISNNIVLFDGTTGKAIKDSGLTIGKSVPSNAKFTDTTYAASTGLTLSNDNKFSITPIHEGGSFGQGIGGPGQSVDFGESIYIPMVTYNSLGQITSATTYTTTLPKLAMKINPSAAEIAAMPDGAFYLTTV